MEIEAYNYKGELIRIEIEEGSIFDPARIKAKEWGIKDIPDIDSYRREEERQREKALKEGRKYKSEALSPSDNFSQEDIKLFFNNCFRFGRNPVTGLSIPNPNHQVSSGPSYTKGVTYATQGMSNVGRFL